MSKGLRAVILAGGVGARLKPYTVVLPKPLMPIGDYPILEVIILQLAHFGFSHITMAVNHQADIIKAYFGDGSRWGITIDYSLESKPLSTMGPLSLISDLPEHFLILNGDVLTDIDYAAFLDEHVNSGRIFSILAHERESRIDYGVLDVDGDSRLAAFREKPSYQFLVSMGIYAASREVLSYIPEGERFGFDDLMHTFLDGGISVAVRRYGGYWLDIGRPDDYMQAIDDFSQIKHRLNMGENGRL